MALFKPAFDITVGDYEGVYSNDTGDSGGVTVYGLTMVADADWSMWTLIKQLLSQGVAMQTAIMNHPEILTSAQDYYKAKYWDKMLCDKIPNQAIAAEIFDTGVNCGTGTAVEFLQQSLNLLNRNGADYDDISVDGSMGNETLNALSKNTNLSNVLLLLNVLQGERYIEICTRNKTQEKFMNGWLKRVSLSAAA